MVINLLWALIKSVEVWDVILEDLSRNIHIPRSVRCSERSGFVRVISKGSVLSDKDTDNVTYQQRITASKIINLLVLLATVAIVSIKLLKLIELFTEE